MLLGWSRSQNHPWENEERGFQLDDMLDFESHQNQHGRIPGICRDHQRSLGVIPCVSRMILNDSKKSWNLAPTWRLRTPKWWSRSIFAVLAHNATSYNINSINIWCEALSSRWPVGARLPKCPSVTFPFSCQISVCFLGLSYHHMDSAIKVSPWETTTTTWTWP